MVQQKRNQYNAQWAGSCWYYLRYIDPTNNKNLLNLNLKKNNARRSVCRSADMQFYTYYMQDFA